MTAAQLRCYSTWGEVKLGLDLCEIRFRSLWICGSLGLGLCAMRNLEWCVG